MSADEKKVLESISKALPHLDEIEKEHLVAYSEGMAYMKTRTASEPAPHK